VPAGTPNGTFATFTIPGQPLRQVELGDFTGSAQFVFDDHQGSVRLDHTFNKKNLFYVRYRFDSQHSSGDGQVTPPGLTLVNELRSSALVMVLNSILTSRSSNEARLAWIRFSSRGDAEFPLSKTIPGMNIPGLGMVASNAQGARLALGFPPTQPGFREHDTYQLNDAFSYVTATHSLKFGVELRRTDARLLGILNTRGTLGYGSPAPLPGQPVNISNFVNDIAQAPTKSFLMAGSDSEGFYRWHEFYAFAQDEWRIRNNLMLTLGVRYEYPGDPFNYLRELNGRILPANGNNPVFNLGPIPQVDANNFMPRIGFNWNPRTDKNGLIGLFTGGDKLVISGGYARTYDPIFMNLYVNIALSFPFVATLTMPTTNAFVAIRDTTVPDLSQANRFARTLFSSDIRSPAMDQISIETQRELTNDLLMKIGYIRTRGTALLQPVDGNPCLPLPASCTRMNPNIGRVGLTTNAGSSTYDALQASLTKRLSRNFSAGLHYTWSTLIDDVTDVIPASTSEFARSQNSFDRRADRARSGYDRPHRLTGNFVYELPFYQHQTGTTGKLFGGWQLNSFFTFQSGAPFTVTLGSDPNGSGNPIRPNLNTNLDLSSMTIREILAAGGTFSRA
jgi:TonB dependent receptor-like, beta-barrel